MSVKIEVGATLPAIPGFVFGVDKVKDTGELTAIRVAPIPGPVRDALSRLNVRTIRISVAPDVQVRTGDDVLVPASSIRFVSPIEFPDKEDSTQMVKLFHLDTDGKTPLKDDKGVPLVWNSVQVSLKGPLAVNRSRVRADQIVGEIPDGAVANAVAAWA